VVKDREKTILDYQAKLRSAINAKNLKLYVTAFLKYVKSFNLLNCKSIYLRCGQQYHTTIFIYVCFSRKDITGNLEKSLKIDTLLLAGTKGSYGSTVQQLHAMMDKQKTQLLKIDDVGDVINESVRRISPVSLQLCKYE